MSTYFGSNGPLAKRLGSAYRQRPQQQRMVDEIKRLQPTDRAYLNGPVAVGKNDAIGVAILESGFRGVLSTYTRTLLDQLETAAKQWAVDFPDKAIKVMRGRSNYVCEAKLQRLKKELDHQGPTVRKRHLKIIEYGESHTMVAGPDAPTGAGVLSQSSCPGASKCSVSASCHYYRERAACGGADLVICTHALVRAMCEYPTMIRDVPHYWFPREIWACDEADRVVDAAVEDLDISGRAIFAMLTDTHVMTESRRKIESIVDFLHERCTGPYGVNLDPADWRGFAERALPTLRVDMSAYTRELARDADEPDGLAGLRRLIAFLDSMLDTPVSCGYAAYVRTPKGAHNPDARRFLSCTLRRRPISVGTAVSDQVELFERFVAVSGSLALPLSNGLSFEFNSAQMGVTPTFELALPSPIHYESNLRVAYEPTPKHFTDAQRREAIGILAVRLHREAGNGIVLCTSFATIAAVETAFRDAGLADELLVQRQDSAENVNALADQLRDGKRASIVATTSGWVGLDLDSRFKSYVMIEKVPVPSPTVDLALHGRMLRYGENAAYEYYGSRQALKLAVQGCGRTLRRETDKCLLVLCDRAFLREPYNAAVPGGKAVTLEAGISWIRSALGAPDAPKTMGDAVTSDNFLDLLEPEVLQCVAVKN